MHLIKLLLVTLAFSFGQSASAQATRFSPVDCEFSIEFPDKYQLHDVHAAGKNTTLAVSKTYPWGQLSAECWPGKPPANISEFAKRIEQTVKEGGFITNSVTSIQGKFGPVVLLLGTATIDGKKFNLTMETHFGRKSRMEAKVIQVEFKGVEHDERFRKSILMK